MVILIVGKIIVVVWVGKYVCGYGNKGGKIYSYVDRCGEMCGKCGKMCNCVSN